MEGCAAEEGAMAQIKLIWTSLSSSRQQSGESVSVRKLPVTYRGVETFVVNKCFQFYSVVSPLPHHLCSGRSGGPAAHR